ncbi:hypothetical protein [Azospirillum isscasi]|uniref:Uncharacterized protein n=1 Tax=Azospirillum isscasi TaxID=3053926 RepID=A0ABU0WIN5_9PROT|nr:hypothetical protein [Azospirillum isscasi]MDQ2102834.1 hypothetical protein [Azospirillum isscasi]
MAHTHATPDRLLSAGRRVLARFGSRTLDHVPADEFINWVALWDELRGDFATQALPHVPAFDDLPPAAREAARAYIRQRLISDVTLGRCEDLHRDLFARGIRTVGVEAYAVARDAYEDSVEAFGAARLRLAGLLIQH